MGTLSAPLGTLSPGCLEGKCIEADGYWSRESKCKDVLATVEEARSKRCVKAPFKNCTRVSGSNYVLDIRVGPFFAVGKGARGRCSGRCTIYVADEHRG